MDYGGIKNSSESKSEDKQLSYAKGNSRTITLPKGEDALKSIDEKLSGNSLNRTVSFLTPLPGILERQSSMHQNLNDVCVVIFDSNSQLNYEMSLLLNTTAGFYCGGIFNDANCLI